MAQELLTAYIELASRTHDNRPAEAHGFRLSPFHSKIIASCCNKLVDQ